MSELLAPPDVERALVALLSVDDWWVGTRYPAQPEQEAAGVIRVSATGGPRPVDRVVTEQTVLVECWHSNAVEAVRIARTAYARLWAAAGSTVGGMDIKHVASTAPVHNPDTGRPQMVRYQFFASIHSRLIPLEV